MSLLETLPVHSRPRERLQQLGAESLTDAELLALLLGSGLRGKNVIDLAEEILARCQGIAGLPRLSVTALREIPGIGDARACLLAGAFELGRRATRAHLQNGEPLTDSERVREYCRTTLSHLTIEHCHLILLDSSWRVLHQQEVSRGTLHETPIYPREIARIALAHNAAGVILVHNHPSENPTPSPADIELTHVLDQILAQLDITLLDHLIVAGPQIASLACLGYLHMPPACN